MSGRAVVIGGGVNGLVAATALARAGRSVVLCEARSAVGGQAAPLALGGGFVVPGLLPPGEGLSPAVHAALELERHGLRLREEPPSVTALDPGGGPPLTLPHAPERAGEAIAARSPADAEGFARWGAELESVRPFFARLFDEPPPDLDAGGPRGVLSLGLLGLALRRLGERAVYTALRLASCSLDDWLADHLEDPFARAALAAPGLDGTTVGPRAAGTTLAWLARIAPARVHAQGGGPALVRALESAARAAGVAVRCDAEVRRIVVERGAARGVELAGGERLEAEVVLATAGPRATLVDLAPAGSLPTRVVAAARRLRARASTSEVLLGYSQAPSLAFGGGSLPERLLLARSPRAMELAAEAVKHGRLADEPWLEIEAPAADEHPLAPPGGAVLRVRVHGTPGELDGGWTDRARASLLARVLELLEPQLSGTGAPEVSRVLAPPDLEREWRLDGGHPQQAQRTLDQMLFQRPLAACARFHTPLPGLLLAGSGSHPGGIGDGTAGLLAARAAGRPARRLSPQG